MRITDIAGPCFAVVSLLACGGGEPPPPPPPSVPVVALPAAPATPPAPPTPPAGEHWFTAEAAAHLRLTRPIAPEGYSVAAVVDLDEQHRAQMHSVHSGVVASIAVKPSQRVKKGDVLLTIDRGARVMEPIRSLMDGEIASIQVGQGDAVAGADKDPRGATPLALVVDLDSVMVTATTLPPGVMVGADALFWTESYASRLWAGKLASVSSDRRQLRCPMLNMDHLLRPGMRGRLDLVLHAPLPVEGVQIPRSAILPGSTAVLVKSPPAPDGRVRFVETRVTTTFDGGAPYVLVTGITKDSEILWDASQS
ncbi:MAG TPA: biotin/lipoyl-binding protein [Polyangiaceae bacterium]|jgi:biotin carboxyl carrier protein